MESTLKESSAAREARLAYYRAWRKNNPEKVKASQTRYWERRAERAANGQDGQNSKT